MTGRLSYVDCSSILLWIVVCGIFVSSADPNYLSEQRRESARDTRTTESDDFFEKFWREQNQGLCPQGQVPQRNNTVCCWVNTCQPEFEIEECRANGTEDTCQKCKDGYTQPNNVSSMDMDNAKCFEVHPSHNMCPEEYKAAKKPLSDKFPLNCQCRLEGCYVQLDSNGNCGEITLPCDFSMQLGGASNSCEPCPWYAYKNEKGCQPCTLNITLLRYGGPDVYYRVQEANRMVVITRAKLPPGTAKTDDQPGLNSSLLFGLIFALIGVLFLMNTLVVIYLCRKRHVSTPVSQDDNSLL